MAKTDRRGPYRGIEALPQDLCDNGYVQDLFEEISAAAKRLGRQVSVNKKNSDWYFVVRVPTVAELARMNVPTAAEEVETVQH